MAPIDRGAVGVDKCRYSVMPVHEYIFKLQEIREVPQFIFSGTILPPNSKEVRSAIFNFLQGRNDVKEIDIILNSSGGYPDEAYRMMRCFRKHFEIVNVVIPFWAKSAASIFALGASQIIMDEFGELGPIDAQIGVEREDAPEYERESALNDEQTLKNIETRYGSFFSKLFQTLYKEQKIKLNKKDLAQLLFESTNRFYEPLLKQIDPYGLGKKQRALSIGQQYAKRMLIQFGKLNTLNRNEIHDFVDYLTNGCPDHGYVIDFDFGNSFIQGLFRSSDTFGSEYENALFAVSKYFMENEEFEYIGFCQGEKVKSENIDQINDNKTEDISVSKEEESKFTIPKKKSIKS